MFSIIMPTYNCKKYVEKAIDSVLNQKFTDFELITVDDGSEDGTYEICVAKAENTPNMTAFKVEHSGVSVARNFGISKAKGEYILFIDCDDTWHSDLLGICQENMSAEEDLLLFGLKSEYYSNDDVLQYSSNELDESKESYNIYLEEDIDKNFGAYNFSSPCNKVYKKSIIEQAKILFSPDCVYLEDLKFNLDYLKNAKTIKVVHKNLYNYRLFIEEKQILKRRFKKPFSNADELFSSVESFLQHKNIPLNEAIVLSSLAMQVYMSEFSYWSRDNGKRKCLTQLNKNKNYIKLLKNMNGKFFAILRFVKKFGFKQIQIKIIERRYQKK